MSTALKVLLVILHADSARGGAEGYCVHLLHALRMRGIDAKIAAATFEAGFDKSICVPLRFDGLTRGGEYRSFLNSLDAHLEASSYDIVHAVLPVRRCDVYHPQAGVESITFPNASRLQQLTNRRRAMFARVEHDLLCDPIGPVVLCLSDRARDETRTLLRDWNRANPTGGDTPVEDRVMTLYNGVESERFVPDASRGKDNPPRVVLVGQDFARKGVDIAIRALARSSSLGVVLEVVGKDDPALYRAIARKLKIEERVRFLGALRDVPAILAGAWALVHPARFEPFGMVIPEAMLMGVAPIVSKASGASEIVRDGVDGRVVDGEAPAAWAAAIGDVVANRDRYAQACLARRVELSYSSHLDKLLAIYGRIIAERR